MHVNCADFVYKAMGELIQVLYLTEPDVEKGFQPIRLSSPI